MRWVPFAVRKNKLHPLATLQQLKLIFSWKTGLVDIHSTENGGETYLLGMLPEKKPSRAGLGALLGFFFTGLFSTSMMRAPIGRMGMCIP